MKPSPEYVLALVCDHYLETGCFLSDREIANRLNCRVATVHAILEPCVFHGLQKIKPRPSACYFYGPTINTLREAYHAK